MSKIMRTLSIIILYLFFYTGLHSQTDSSFYFPMNQGNLWQYKEPPPPEDLYPQETRIGRDTTFTNGHTYRSFVNKYIGYSDTIGLIKYERKLGDKVYRYYPNESQEYLIYDFSKKVGDTVSIFPNPMGFAGDTSIVMVLDAGINNTFGSLRRYMTFYYQPTHGSLYWIDRITDGIGLTGFQIEPGYQLYLVGAIIDGLSYGTVTKVSLSAQAFPNTFGLLQNYPNPFNPTTTITFSIPPSSSPLLSERKEVGFVSLRIYDILGREVETLVDEYKFPGTYSVRWNAKNYTSGVYFYRLTAGNNSLTKKLILLK